MHTKHNDSTSIHQHPPTTDPSSSDTAPFWEVVDESEAAKLPRQPFGFVDDFFSPGAASASEQASRSPAYDQLTAQPGDDEPSLPTKQRESYAAQVAARHSSWRVRAALPDFYEDLIFQRLRKGVKVKLSDGRRHPTAIQRSGERIRRRTLSLALRKAAYAFRQHGLSFTKHRALRTQLLALRFSEALALQDLLNPELSASEIALEAELVLGAVLEAIQSLDAAHRK